MKNTLLNYLLLTDEIYRQPLRRRKLLLALCFGAGIVFMLSHSARYGFGFFTNIYGILTAAVLIMFTGIFALVMFSWPISDMILAYGKGVERIGFAVKRMKLVKGFLFAVIYTGSVAAVIKIIVHYFLEINTAALVTEIVSALSALWAGAMLTRCIIAVFRETKFKKWAVFAVASVWYYLTAVQIIAFIIKTAYSIIH